MSATPTGVLLVQLGTPDAPTPRAVRRYLREFLSDPRVLDIPGLPRRLLLETVILPTRPRRSAAAYKKIWTPEGSPLLVHSRALAESLARALGPDYRVALGMRYGEPALGTALKGLAAAGALRVLVLPLFPQWAASSTGSAFARAAELAAAEWDPPELELLGPFWSEPGFVEAWRETAREPLAAFRPDHVLFSFHGLPERQIRKSDRDGRTLPRERRLLRRAARRSAARAATAPSATRRRRRSPAPSAHPAGPGPSRSSRGSARTPWIRPYTDVRLPELAAAGVKRLAVLCPAFVADCLETLEEIGIRGREQWRAAGGDELLLVPSLNAHPVFAATLAAIVRRRAARG